MSLKKVFSRVSNLLILITTQFSSHEKELQGIPVFEHGQHKTDMIRYCSTLQTLMAFVISPNLL